MSSSMVVMVLKLMVVVAKVVLLHLPPLQVHLQPLFSPLRGFRDKTLLSWNSKKNVKPRRAMLLGWLRQQTALSRPQHPASPTSGPPPTHLNLSTNETPRRRQLPLRQPIRARRAAALVWRLGKRFASPSCISSPASHGFHPSLPACTADPAFALFSSGCLLTLSPSSLTGHLEPD